MDKQKSIGLEIKSLSNMIRRRIDEIRPDEEKEKISEVTGVQGWIIGYIYEHSQTQDVFQKDIEKAFNIRRSTATGILQLLEKKGYIKKVSVEKDARLKKLILTDKAAEMYVLLIERINEIENKLKQGLSEGEMMMFFEVIEKIKKNITS